MIDIRIDGVLTGTPRAFGPDGRTSTIASRYPASGPVAVGPDGFAGDAVADTRNHGGADKAVHHYPRDHYTAWVADLQPGAPTILGEVGAFGENISTSGITEEDVCIGDCFRAGSALVQVSQARQPCWKLNVRFATPDMAKRVQTTGRTGWYYRVLDPGEIGLGDRLVLESRPQPEWSLARILHVLYHDTLNRDALAAIAGIPELADGWRRLAARRLETMKVEDWSARLQSA
ncbi:MOSC domain-containing protein [Caenispirillum bisanense]|uniref:MOSC domain-containing protein YiiM n=1 Tax=Caenispirillum bisanense TaxID=414052 RepID=A0A286GPS6_9PROT|nr:MOSC domain-containing protein [Caenispirillum bisanense]SOD97186.1 MOSC domain-containing protein YiiM [Caenispirillum bisanense]